MATAICRHYLRATRFELVTDSKVVQALLTKEVPTRRANLVLRLSEFEFTVTHRKGEHNANADFMSRWAAYKDWSKQKAVEAAEIEVFALPLEPGPDPKSVNRLLAVEQRKDPKIGLIIKDLEIAARERLQSEKASQPVPVQPDTVMAQLAPEPPEMDEAEKQL